MSTPLSQRQKASLEEERMLEFAALQGALQESAREHRELKENEAKLAAEEKEIRDRVNEIEEKYRRQAQAAQQAAPHAPQAALLASAAEKRAAAGAARGCPSKVPTKQKTSPAQQRVPLLSGYVGSSAVEDWLNAVKKFDIMKVEARGNGLCLWNAWFMASHNCDLNSDGGAAGGKHYRDKMLTSEQLAQFSALPGMTKHDALEFQIRNANDYAAMHALRLMADTEECTIVVLHTRPGYGPPYVFVPTAWQNVPVEELPHDFLAKSTIILSGSNHFSALCFSYTPGGEQNKVAVVRNIIEIHMGQHGAWGHNSSPAKK